MLRSKEIEGGKRKRLRWFEDSSRYCQKKNASLLPYVLKQGLFFLCVVVGQRCCLRWTRSRTSKLSLGWFPLLSNWHKTACYAPIPLLYWIPMWLCGCPDTHERTSMTEKRAKHSACRHLSPQYLVFTYLWCLCRRFSRLEVNKHLLRQLLKRIYVSLYRESTFVYLNLYYPVVRNRLAVRLVWLCCFAQGYHAILSLSDLFRPSFAEDFPSWL